MLVMVAIISSIATHYQYFDVEKSINIKAGKIGYANSGTSNGVRYITKNDTVVLTLKGTDTNYLSNSLTKEEIVVKVGGNTITPTTKELSSPTNITNGVQYKLTLSGVSGNGELSIEIAENTLKDKVNKQNILTTFKSGIIVDNIGPTIDLTANVTLWTNQDITVNATYSDTNEIRSKSLTCTGIENTDYIVNGTTNIVVKTNNNTITASVTDIAGNRVVKTLTITNIDKVAPVISTFSSTPNGDYTSKLTLTGSDTGGSTLKQCRITGINFDQTYTFSGYLNVSVPENTRYTAIIYDKAGNVSTSKSLTTGSYNYNIDDTYWVTTLSEAVSNAKSTGSVIKVIRDITDSSSVTIDKSLTLNLNGKTLTRAGNYAKIIVNTGVSFILNGGGTITTNNISQNLLENYGITQFYPGTGTVTGATGRNEYTNSLIANRSSGEMYLGGGTFISDGHTVGNDGGKLEIFPETSVTITNTSSDNNLMRAAVWNIAGTTSILPGTIINSTNSVAVLNYNEQSTNDNVIEMKGGQINGQVRNIVGAYRMTGGTIYQGNSSLTAFENYANLSITAGIIYNNSSKGTFANKLSGNVWHSGGTIQNMTGGTAVWNEGNWFKEGGTIIGGSNV